MSIPEKTTKDVMTIAHATDLHPDGGIAFRHGVAMARDGAARLCSMHANPVTDNPTAKMHDAQELLKSWHGTDAPEIDFYKMVHTCCDDPVDALLDAMRQIEPDLLIVGKHQVKGFFRFLRESVSESLALNTRVPTLFVPIGKRGFVDEASGRVQLDRLLLPVKDDQSFQRSFEMVNKLLQTLGREDVEIVLLHVADDSVPAKDAEVDGKILLDKMVNSVTEDGLRWRCVQRQGDLADEIVDSVEEFDIDMVVMATQGHDSLGDVLGGSRTERVVRRGSCPLLSVPLEQ